jgi:cyclopropane fatty-acyl-phospholipid synthase-like methyltransferase
MGQLLEIVTPLHQATQRDYLARMQDEKIHCMQVAKQYEIDYWDGNRRYGYGGYKYIPGRWKPVAEALIQKYQLGKGSKVLDMGCGKGFLLHEMKLIIPELVISGIDISTHGLANAKEEIKPFLFHHEIQNPLPFGNKEYDLVISMGTFHNLRVFELKTALFEMERVGKQGYLMLESYRNEKELFNLQCWALTAESFFDVSEWIWLYQHFGFTGDYEFIYFE